jgi:hypothetical protein
MRTFLLSLILLGLILAAARPGQATPGEVLVPRLDHVPLRASDSAAAPRLLFLDRGQRLLEFRRQGEWVEVAVFGMVAVRGWVRSDSVMVEPALPDPPPARPASPESTAAEAGTRSFVLDISGTPALAFRAKCRVVDADGTAQTIERAGLSPERFAAEAAAISCRVRKADADGRLRVRLHAGRVPLAEAQTRAAFNWVRVRSDGPWGSAGGLRGSVGLVLREPSESPQRGKPIPPLSRKPLPPLRQP